MHPDRCKEQKAEGASPLLFALYSGPVRTKPAFSNYFRLFLFLL